tara:strand:+ start:3656 stop:3934 length:279 start_codon:yes stop_codon:yes gene_type:complete
MNKEELEKAYCLLLLKDRENKAKHNKLCKKYYNKTNKIDDTKTEEEIIEIKKTKQKRNDYQKKYYAENKALVLEKQRNNYKTKKSITIEIAT